MATSPKARPEKQACFRADIYQLLRRYQEGRVTGNSTVVGKLDQSLTGVYDEILAIHDRVGIPRTTRASKE